jgi:hypothetical protein
MSATWPSRRSTCSRTLDSSLKLASSVPWFQATGTTATANAPYVTVGASLVCECSTCSRALLSSLKLASSVPCTQIVRCHVRALASRFPDCRGSIGSRALLSSLKLAITVPCKLQQQKEIQRLLYDSLCWGQHQPEPPTKPQATVHFNSQ